MKKPNAIDLVLLSSTNHDEHQVGKIRITDNRTVEVLSADNLWQERIKQMADTINQADEIPVIGGTKINRLGTFTMMETVKKGDAAFPEAIAGYLKINGLEARKE